MSFYRAESQSNVKTQLTILDGFSVEHYIDAADDVLGDDVVFSPCQVSSD